MRKLMSLPNMGTESLLPLWTLRISVCEVAEQANQGEKPFLENVEVKPPSGEVWRPLMWRMGPRETRPRLQQCSVSCSRCQPGEGAPSVQGEGRPGNRWPGCQGFTGERQGTLPEPLRVEHPEATGTLDLGTSTLSVQLRRALLSSASLWSGSAHCSARSAQAAGRGLAWQRWESRKCQAVSSGPCQDLHSLHTFSQS